MDDDKHINHDHMDHHAHMVEDFKRRFFVSLILMVPILALSPMIQMFFNVDWSFSGDRWLLLGLSTVLFIYGGKPFLTGAVDELKQRSPAMMTLIALAIIVSYVYSTFVIIVGRGNDFFWELATLIVVMLLGHWIEMRSVIGASRALDELVKLMPETAHLIQPDGSTKEIPLAELKTGDKVLVKPGEKVPIDGEIFAGHSAVDEAMITGESVPVEKQAGDELIGGSINGDGILSFTVSRTGEDTFLSQVIHMVREAQASKSHTQRLADIAARWLFYIAVTAGLITFAAWMLLDRGIEFAVERAVTVIVISCPHALGLAIPLVTAISTSIGANKGLLIRDRAAFENARNLNAVVFDKTGTLTQGQFGLTDIIPMAIAENELLTLAYSIEANSEHPIAHGIVREAEQRGLQLLPVSNYRNLTGQGLMATVDERNLSILSPGAVRDKGIVFDEAAFDSLAAAGKTVVFVVDGRSLLGALALADLVRESAKQAVTELKEMQVEPIMLTGDNPRAAAYIAEQVKIDKVIAEVLPQDKAEIITDLQREGRRVAMAGDGVNDAPALAQADLGIAIGAGTDVAIETADVILVRSDPLDVVSILKLSRATYRKMIQNLIWATAYNIIALPLAAGILYDQGIVISPALGAVFMSLSTIIVAINARLLRISD
ncbi:MAG: copper-translocating P-type ATPase [Saccharofermentanales bacterium]|jgi:Cu2+-exporting ATPase